MKSWLAGNDSFLACAVECYGRIGTWFLLGIVTGGVIALVGLIIYMIER